MAINSKKRNRFILGSLGVLLGVYLIYNIFSSTDISSTASVLSSISIAGIALIFVPSMIGAGLDSLAWEKLLPEQVQENAFWRVVKVRMASESVVSTVPMGSVVADPLKAWLLKRYFSLSLACGTASVALRTFVLAEAQAAIVFLVALSGFSWLTVASNSLLHNSYLGWITLFVSLAGAVTYGVLILAACSGSLTDKIHLLLKKINSKKLRTWLVTQESHFAELSKELSSFGRERAPTVWMTIGIYAIVWSMEGLESYIILHLMGSTLSFFQIYALEAVCSFIRSVAFIIPSGLGAQDAGYVAFITGSGESQAMAVAFILVKRLRQATWILAGLLILFIFRRKHVMPAPII